MKTETEVRELLAVLRRARNSPCDCMERGDYHEMRCVQGGRMMDAAIDGLLWVLGEGGEVHDKMLERAKGM